MVIHFYIFVQCGGRVFQQRSAFQWEQIVLLSLLTYSYEADFIANLIRKDEHRLARPFKLSVRYIDDELSFNNPSFGDLMHRIYPKEHMEINDTTDTVKSASYLDLQLRDRW